MNEYAGKLEKEIVKQRSYGRAAFTSGAFSLGVGMILATPSVAEVFADGRPNMTLAGAAIGSLALSKLSFAQGRANHEEASARQAVLDQHLLQHEASLPQPIPETDVV